MPKEDFSYFLIILLFEFLKRYNKLSVKINADQNKEKKVMKYVYSILLGLILLSTNNAVFSQEDQVKSEVDQLLKTNYYRLLGVTPKDNEAEISRAFKKFGQKWHPDKETGNIDVWTRGETAKAVLTDPERKALYDKALTLRRVNYYALLGVNKNTSSKDLENAFTKFTDTWKRNKTRDTDLTEIANELIERAERAKNALLIKRKADKLFKVNYYKLLRVKENATEDKITKAFDKFVDRWEERKENNKAIKETIEDLLARAERAKNTLLSPETRAQYDALLAKKNQPDDDEKDIIDPTRSGWLGTTWNKWFSISKQGEITQPNIKTPQEDEDAEEDDYEWVLPTKPQPHQRY